MGKKEKKIYISKIFVELIRNSSEPQKKLFKKVIKQIIKKEKLKIKCIIMMKKKKK